MPSVSTVGSNFKKFCINLKFPVGLKCVDMPTRKTTINYLQMCNNNTLITSRCCNMQMSVNYAKYIG